uniref:Uncharacterized protein n=1 Tax=Glossina pallidipes TaxID=7398 RepID=A0A1B0ABX8_GLOPL
MYGLKLNGFGSASLEIAALETIHKWLRKQIVRIHDRSPLVGESTPTYTHINCITLACGRAQLLRWLGEEIKREIFKLHKNSVRPIISDFVVLRNKKCTIDTSRIPVVLLKIPSGYPPLEFPKVPAIIGDVLKPVPYDNSKQPGKQSSHASESFDDSIFINKRLVHALSLGPQMRIEGSLRGK